MAEFDRKVADYRRQLVDFVRRRLPMSDRDAASDFVQDALLEAQERAELLRALTPQQTYAWLVAVLKYKMANANRTRRRRRRLDAARAAAIPETLELVPTPDELAERKERMRRVERALAELTAGQRLAIVLRFYAGWTLDEIARQTGRTRASTLRRIRRGLTHLETSGALNLADLA
jgi:RNA polymerase sigma factor (sigma-70 family)